MALISERAQQTIQSMLKNALGPDAGEFLIDDLITELMLNPDGKLWIDRFGVGVVDSGITINPNDALRVIQIVSSGINEECNESKPTLEAELPGSGHRFQGVLPPVVDNPTFCIRKKAIKVYSLNDYVEGGLLAPSQNDNILASIRERKNILVVGGTSSGKTTFMNAILHELSSAGRRFVLIEDTVELQCDAPNKVPMRSKKGVVTMDDLLETSLRLNPDSIIVGEVRRGPECLSMLKAWNTGHPGGCCSIHADSAAAAMQRIEELVGEVSMRISHRFIAEAIDVLIFMKQDKAGKRMVEQVLKVNGYDGKQYRFLPVE